MQELETKVRQAEQQMTTRGGDVAKEQLLRTQQAYKTYMWEEAKTRLSGTQHKIYEAGDKAGKLLAWLGKAERATKWVATIKITPHREITDPLQITEAFAEHFSQLYHSTMTDTITECLHFLQDIKLPLLNSDVRAELESSLTAEEIGNGIAALKVGKAVGPNGIPIELYRATSSRIAPHLLTMFTESLERGELPYDQRVATIVAIHKPNKPQSDCSSYRPISLLNAEAKILAKVLATRLQPHLGTLIHPDQSGFMPNRNTALNLRRLNSVLARKRMIQEEAVILSLDARMAFDLLEWPFLFAVLRRLGFGPKFCAWIELLYTKPLAQVAINGCLSETFPLNRGTRQGCPLSPLLFALFLEPLAAWIRQDPRLRGLKWTMDWEDRISLYADDILLYLASLAASINCLLDICTAYGRMSGYTINWEKSCLYILKVPPPSLPSNCNLQIKTEGFKYLGIHVTHDADKFYRDNLKNQLAKLHTDVMHWRSLPLTLLGRAALFKMMGLPRFLYALHNTPFLVPNSYFQAINAEIALLLWDGKVSRIAQHKLTRSWYDGGIALPNIKYYYWASQLQVINQWLHSSQTEPAYRLDRYQIHATRIFTELYSKRPNVTLINPTLHVIQIWHAAQRAMGWKDQITLVTPLWVTPKLGKLQNTKGFNKWDNIGISTVADLWHKGAMIPFEQLQIDFGLPKAEIFRYMQIKHALQAVLGRAQQIPEASPLEDRILAEYLPKRAVSLIYKKNHK